MPDRGGLLTAYPWLSKVLFDICTESPGDMYITLKIFLSSILQAQNVFCAHTADARRQGNAPGTWAPTAARENTLRVCGTLSSYESSLYWSQMRPLRSEKRASLSQTLSHYDTWPPNLLVLPWCIELLTKLLSSSFICSFPWMWLKRIHLRHKEQLDDLKQAL